MKRGMVAVHVCASLKPHLSKDALREARLSYSRGPSPYLSKDALREARLAALALAQDLLAVDGQGDSAQALDKLLKIEKVWIVVGIQPKIATHENEAYILLANQPRENVDGPAHAVSTLVDMGGKRSPREARQGP
jgi:hypothetical protein